VPVGQHLSSLCIFEALTITQRRIKAKSASFLDDDGARVQEARLGF
jgi:hypothetical protein